tara:strand:+ start:669 stop:851 length:183 start_codon:yes stop_codon:yes gene_type:complete
MMLNKKGIMQLLIIVTFSWVLFSVIGSLFKATDDNCGAEYPIGTILHTNLFCEIKEQDND